MFILTIETDNAAFDDIPHSEIARLLRGIAQRVEDGESVGRVKDVNGNNVGSFVYSKE